MPTDPLGIVGPNDPVRFSATRENTISEAVRWVQQQRPGMRSNSTTDLSPIAVWVKNNTELDRERFEVMGITGVVTTPAENEEQFAAAVSLLCELPGDPAVDGSGTWVVLDDKIPAGQIGRAFVYGVCQVKLTIEDADHRFAEVVEDDPQLHTAESGAAQILWKESGTGADKWAVIRIGNAPGLPVWGRALDDWTDLGETRVRVFTGNPGAAVATDPAGTAGTWGKVTNVSGLTSGGDPIPEFSPWLCDPSNCGSAPIFVWDDIDEEWDLDDANGCGGTPVPPPYDGVEGETACGSCE
jgi:hypothetical protein